MGHEHGSDPALLGTVIYPDGSSRNYTPSLGFVAFYNDKQNESNIGFKGYVIKGQEVDLYINAHTTSSAMGRICAQFHTVLVVGFDKEGHMLFELGYKSDFGAAITEIKKNNKVTREHEDDENGDSEEMDDYLDVYDDNYDEEEFSFAYGFVEDDYEAININNEPFEGLNSEEMAEHLELLSQLQAEFGEILENPFLDLSCRDQSQVQPNCRPEFHDVCKIRRFRVKEHDEPYEIWSTIGNDIIKFPRMLEIDIREPITGCTDMKCESLYLTGSDGTKRSLILRQGVVVRYNPKFDLDGDGYFLTDQYGSFLRDINLESCKDTAGGCASNLEMIQYIRPDASVGYCDGEASSFPEDGDENGEDEEEEGGGEECNDSADFDAGFGGCDSYATGAPNHDYCAEDVDSNGVSADDACMKSCQLCEEKDEEDTKCRDNLNFSAGFGGCDTYAPGGANQDYCEHDFDESLQQTAETACPVSCDSCNASDLGDSKCQNDEDFETKYGKCDSYSLGGSNHAYCATDSDLQGVLAKDACKEACNNCGSKNKTPSLSKGASCKKSPYGLFGSENVYTFEYKMHKNLQNNMQDLGFMNALNIGADSKCSLECTSDDGPCVCYQN